MDHNRNAILLLVVGVVFFAACKKDTLPPVLNLFGEAKIEIAFDSVAIDPGAYAFDKTDGNLSNQIMSDWNSVVNPKQCAVNQVNYVVKDKSGNETKATREVVVKMFGNSFIGNYSSTWFLTGTLYTGNSNYTISKGTNHNQFIINSYGPHLIELKINLSGNLGQNLSFYQSDDNVITEGTGNYTNNGETINLNFRRTYTNGAVIHGTETLTKI